MQEVPREEAHNRIKRTIIRTTTNHVHTHILTTHNIYEKTSKTNHRVTVMTANNPQICKTHSTIHNTTCCIRARGKHIAGGHGTFTMQTKHTNAVSKAFAKCEDR